MSPTDEVPPLQGFRNSLNTPTQGVALGWHNAAPLGLKSQVLNFTMRGWGDRFGFGICLHTGFALVLFTIASSLSAAEPDDVSADLEALVKKYKVPALAVAVLEGDRLVKLGATGIRARGHEEKVTLGDLWHLSSCTKAMTATLCARLVEKGSLRWDMTLGEAFSKEVERIHADLRGVTLEQLLSHCAGLPANPPQSVMRKMLASGESRAARELLLSEGLLEKAPEYKPGAKFLYSNFGFMLAGLMAERAMDKDWEALMREELFEPLGMKSAGFGPPGSAKEVDQQFPVVESGRIVFGPV